MSKRKILWAPWRKNYITSGETSKECVFCMKASSDKDRENLVIHRGKEVFALLNLYPYNNGHVLIVPYKHTSDPMQISPEEYAELLSIMKKLIEIIKDKMNPEGFNMGMNIGKAGGAGIEDHIHMHLLPRWKGDTNFMSVTGGARVMSESLESVYEKLKF